MNCIKVKQILTGIFFFICINCTFAQVKDTLPWCPPGATWIYKSFTATERLYFKFEYEKDTVIDGHTSKVLAVHSIFFAGFGDDYDRHVVKRGEEYLYVSNDSLFWYDKIQNQFALIYDFSLQQGDTFQTTNSRVDCRNDENYPKEVFLTVDTTYNWEIGGRIFSFNGFNNEGSLIWGGIVKNIGSVVSPFAQINRNICTSSESEYGEFYEGLVCYSDNLRGTLVFEFDEAECEKIATKVRTQTYNNLDSFFIYPHPVTDFMSISSPELIKKVEIYDVNGRLLKHQERNFSNISTIDLPTGLYVLKISDVQVQNHFVKMIKK